MDKDVGMIYEPPTIEVMGNMAELTHGPNIPEAPDAPYPGTTNPIGPPP